MKPILIDAARGFATGRLKIVSKGIFFDKVLIPYLNIYSKIQATMYGLNDALVAAEKGTELRSRFEVEMQKLMRSFEKHNDLFHYGTFAYYKRHNQLVQYAPAEMNRLAMIASNSSLYLDPQMSLSFDQAQNILRKIHPAIMGLSVGSNITKAIMQVVRPDKINIADPAMFKATNQNRVTGLGYSTMLLTLAEQQKESSTIYGLRNKAAVLAEQLYSEDPYVDINYFEEGVTKSNIHKFLQGVDVIVDVADSTEFKLALAIEAKRRGIRYLRITDAGDSVWMDIRPFDIDKNIGISPDIEDEKLFELERVATTSRENFFKFADALVGKKHRKRPGEFSALVNGKLPKYVASIPQTGAATMVGGGWCANTIARMFLGHPFQERMVFDMRKCEVQKYFKLIPGLKVV